MQHQWNTGRYFTPNRQRIIAATVDNGVIFNDIDREIGGFIPNKKKVQTEHELQTTVMFNYDRGSFRTWSHEYNNQILELDWVD